MPESFYVGEVRSTESVYTKEKENSTDDHDEYTAQPW